MGTSETGLKLIHRGAEADLYLSERSPWATVTKKRMQKEYREKQLDARIRRDRTFREAASLQEARRAGVRTPTVLAVHVADCSIEMSYVHGELARDTLDKLPRKDMAHVLRDVGRQVGLLHMHGMVHGDLTTSNIIVAEGKLPFILDFGMSNRSTEVEERAVDLHLLRRSISTSHKVPVSRGFRTIMEGYSKATGKHVATLVLKKVSEISRRGRYFAIR